MAPVKTSVTELPESRVRLEAEVGAEEVERHIQQAATELGRELRVPGFRKGKVPPPVVIRRLGRGAVLDQAVRSSLGGWYIDALDRAGIAPIGEPDLDVGELPAEGEPLAFSIEIGVLPKAKLGNYKGLEVGRREAQVDDELIEQEVQRLRERTATLETVPRPAATGDSVVIDYLGEIDDQAFAGGEGRDQLVELGSGRLVADFEEQLVGASAGEEREVLVTFPENYHGEVAGKSARFAVTVKEVKAKRLPELDDEFASQAGGFETLVELHEDIATRMKEIDGRSIELEYQRAVLDAAVANAEIEVPSKLVHARAHEILHQTLSTVARQGISKELYLQLAGKDEEDLANEAEPEAAAALRREAVLAAIVAAEPVRPSEEELLESLKPSAERESTTPEELAERLRSGGRLERVRAELATSQALDLLVSQAKAISVEQAQAREKLWTPGGDAAESGEADPGRIWTPGS